MNIKFNKIHLIGSPFKVQIGNNNKTNQIKLNTSEMKTGVLGDQLKILIDTRQVNPGELTANCNGSTKPALCEFKDERNGTYTLLIKPQEVGKHILQLKYNDVHVEGSPLTLKILAPPDEKKVKVFGPGISNGVLNEFQSDFICDTRGAGNLNF